MIITKTPYRLSFFGGGTDYNSWYEENGGLVVGCAFSRYCYISVRPLPPFFDHKTRVVYSKIERVGDNLEVIHPSVRGCLQHLGVSQGLEIHHDGDLPARSGIGSSSSFTVGMLLALHANRSEMITKRQLASEAIEVEQNVIKENVGIQDQILVAHGGIQIIEMGPGSGYRVSPLILPKEYKENFESHILLGFTGFQRNSTDVAKDHVSNIKVGKSASQLKEIHGIAKEGLSLLSQNRDFREVGKLFDKTWQIKRSLSSSVSTESIDTIYKSAIEAGAYGGRLMGAGGGGFIMFIAPPDRHSYIKYKLEGQVKVWVPFSFDDDGAQVLLHCDS